MAVPLGELGGGPCWWHILMGHRVATVSGVWALSLQ